MGTSTCFDHRDRVWEKTENRGLKGGTGTERKGRRRTFPGAPTDVLSRSHYINVLQNIISPVTYTLSHATRMHACAPAFVLGGYTGLEPGTAVMSVYNAESRGGRTRRTIRAQCVSALCIHYSCSPPYYPLSNTNFYLQGWFVSAICSSNPFGSHSRGRQSA